MSVFRSLLNAFQSWRRRRAPRDRRRAGVAMERLDHRQLLAVNFTGNAILDIPDSTAPGFAIVRDADRVPIRNPQLNQLIKVSGFDISAIRMQYTPDDDVLSVAIEQPLNEKTDPQFPVIAGDADNNGDGGTVDPAVRLVQPLFMDFANLGGSETMAVFFDLDNDRIPDVVAGIPNTPGAGKLFTVSDAVVSPDPDVAASSAPAFGTPLPSHTGYAFLRDTEPEHGAFEFQITNFSVLYKEKTGQDLAVDSIVGVGGFGGSNDDFIDEEFVAAQPVSFGVVPPPPPVEECPPISPPIVINPHQHRHVNTAHPELVRVTFFGTSGFDVVRILPETVRLGGAAPVAHFTRHVDRDEFLDATYVFRGDQIDLPPGVNLAHVTGQYLAPDGKVLEIDTAKIIFVRDASSYGPGQVNAQLRRQAIRGVAPAFPPGYIARRARQAGVDLVIDELQAEDARPWSPAGRPTVTLPLGGAAQAVRRAGHGEALRVAAGRPTPKAPPTRVVPRVPADAIAPPTVALAPRAAGSVAGLRAQRRMDGAGYLDDLATSLAS